MLTLPVIALSHDVDLKILYIFHNAQAIGSARRDLFLPVVLQRPPELNDKRVCFFYTASSYLPKGITGYQDMLALRDHEQRAQISEDGVRQDV